MISVNTSESLSCIKINENYFTSIPYGYQTPNHVQYSDGTWGYIPDTSFSIQDSDWENQNKNPIIRLDYIVNNFATRIHNSVINNCEFIIAVEKNDKMIGLATLQGGSFSKYGKPIYDIFTEITKTCCCLFSCPCIYIPAHCFYPYNYDLFQQGNLLQGNRPIYKYFRYSIDEVSSNLSKIIENAKNLSKNNKLYYQITNERSPIELLNKIDLFILDLNYISDNVVPQDWTTDEYPIDKIKFKASSDKLSMEVRNARKILFGDSYFSKTIELKEICNIHYSFQ